PEEMLSYLGLDSATSYVWIHYLETQKFPETPYAELLKAARDANDRFSEEYSFPYFPNVTTGWDSSPRTIQTDEFENLGYPYVPVLSGNTPQAFAQALRDAREFLDTVPKAANTLLINAWNEWTEGSYLEPDTQNGFGFLEAIQDVFGK
ncbi:MAG: glycoside hydrolase family 99-like domain-containing protein, partial [Ruthenibacterium sp.]